MIERIHDIEDIATGLSHGSVEVTRFFLFWVNDLIFAGGWCHTDQLLKMCYWKNVIKIPITNPNSGAIVMEKCELSGTRWQWSSDLFYHSIDDFSKVIGRYPSRFNLNQCIGDKFRSTVRKLYKTIKEMNFIHFCKGPAVSEVPKRCRLGGV